MKPLLPAPAVRWRVEGSVRGFRAFGDWLEDTWGNLRVEEREGRSGREKLNWPSLGVWVSPGGTETKQVEPGSVTRQTQWTLRSGLC